MHKIITTPTLLIRKSTCQSKKRSHRSEELGALVPVLRACSQGWKVNHIGQRPLKDGWILARGKA